VSFCFSRQDRIASSLKIAKEIRKQEEFCENSAFILKWLTPTPEMGGGKKMAGAAPERDLDKAQRAAVG
jgi:hypothetical protein